MEVCVARNVVRCGSYCAAGFSLPASATYHPLNSPCTACHPSLPQVTLNEALAHVASNVASLELPWSTLMAPPPGVVSGAVSCVQPQAWCTCHDRSWCAVMVAGQPSALHSVHVCVLEAATCLCCWVAGARHAVRCGSHLGLHPPRSCCPHRQEPPAGAAAGSARLVVSSQCETLPCSTLLLCAVQVPCMSVADGMHPPTLPSFTAGPDPGCCGRHTRQPACKRPALATDAAQPQVGAQVGELLLHVCPGLLLWHNDPRNPGCC